MLILVNILNFKWNVGFGYNYFASRFGTLQSFEPPVKEKLIKFTTLRSQKYFKKETVAFLCDGWEDTWSMYAMFFVLVKLKKKTHSITI